MPGELERLLVKIEADTTQLRRALAEADKGVGAFAGNTDKNATKAKQSFAAYETGVVSGLKRMGVAFAAFGVARSAVESFNTAASLNDMARTASLSVEAFQVLRQAVETTGGSMESLSKASKKFSINMADLRAGTGALDSFLKDHLPRLREQLLATKNQEEAYRVFADGLAALRNEEDRSALAAAGLGKNFEDMVDAIGIGGAKSLDDARKRAEELGNILSEKLATDVENTKKDFDELAGFLENKFMRVVVATGNAVRFMFNSGEEGGTQTSGRRGLAIIDAINKRKGSAAPAPPPTAADLGRFGFAGSGSLELPPKGAGSSLMKKGETGSGDWTAELDFSSVDQLADLRKRLADASGEAFESIRLDYESDLEGYRRLLADKKISAEEFETARADLSAITSARLAEQMQSENAAYRQHFAEIEGFIGQTFNGVFAEALETGKINFQSFVASTAKGFAMILQQALILKPIMDSLFGTPGAAGASLFGSLLGVPQRAAGGPMLAGVPHLVGERGPELVVPSTSSRAFSNSDTRGMSAGGSVTYNIDARGADISVAERIERALGMSQRRQNEPVSAVAGYGRRFPSR